MTATIAAVTFAAVVLYALLGGADYGAGVWDLLAGRGKEGAERRHQIDRSLGPVWETNHVWLIFVLVFLWTGQPHAFAQVVTTLAIPLGFAAIGIVYRGSAFAFRKVATTFAGARWFGVLFAGSSLVTPFFLGAVAGALASGRVPADGTGDALTSWVNPSSLLGGVLAVGTCAWSAAVLLAADAQRDGAGHLARWFARRALVVGAGLGAVALAAVAVLEVDAPTLAHRLQGRGAAAVVVSALAGLTALGLLAAGRYRAARLPALAAVAAIVIGWGVAQYPWLLVDELRLDERPAPRSTEVALLITTGLAAALVLPSLGWLLRLSDVGALAVEGRAGSSDARLSALRSPGAGTALAPGPDEAPLGPRTGPGDGGRSRPS